MSNDAVILMSRVRLARNYEDLPFDTASRPDEADTCVTRTASALAKTGEDKGFDLVWLRDLSEAQRKALVESHTISGDLYRNADTAAVLVNPGASLSVMMNEDDHLRIQSVLQGLSLNEAAQQCFRVDDALSRQVKFAFDEQLGYLTACPTNTGTGMRASLLLHLPMLTRCKQMGSVGQIVAKVGLTIRGVYGEGSEAQGYIYQVSNQVTLGRTEEEIISAVTTVGHQLRDMELALREKAMHENPLLVEDGVFRAWGILTGARYLTMPEFLRHWSQIRMGCDLGMIDLDARMLDDMLTEVQDAHLRLYAEQALDEAGLRATRATRVRSMLNGRDSNETY